MITAGTGAVSDKLQLVVALRISQRCGKQSVPPRGSGWVRSVVRAPRLSDGPDKLRPHPLPRAGTDCFATTAHSTRRLKGYETVFSRC